MKKIFLAALTFGIAVLTNGLVSKSVYAQAVTGEVQIKAVVPDIVFLETYTDITFNMNAADLTTNTPGLIQTTAQGGPGSGVVTAGSSTLTPPLSATTSGQTNKTFSNILVYRTWGIGGSTGKIEHGAALTNSTLTSSNDPTSTMTLAAGKAKVTETAPGLDSTNALPGSMDFTFDLNNVKESGIYTGAVLTVSAEGV